MKQRAQAENAWGNLRWSHVIRIWVERGEEKESGSVVVTRHKQAMGWARAEGDARCKEF